MTAKMTRARAILPIMTPRLNFEMVEGMEDVDAGLVGAGAEVEGCARWEGEEDEEGGDVTIEVDSVDVSGADDESG